VARKITDEDLRRELAGERIERYVIAPMIPMHPGRLSRLLNGRSPLDQETAARILHAIKQEAARRRGNGNGDRAA
jgi:plasmid maintenance system antidote protein VapI